jgi:hypothetical protein
MPTTTINDYVYEAARRTVKTISSLHAVQEREIFLGLNRNSFWQSRGLKTSRQIELELLSAHLVRGSSLDFAL